MELAVFGYIWMIRNSELFVFISMIIYYLLSDVGEDLTTSRDGGIVRNMLQKGEGHSFPNSGASVTSKLVGTSPNDHR